MRPWMQQKRPQARGQIVRSLLYIVLILLVLGAEWYILPASVDYHIVERYVFSSPPQPANAYLALVLPRSGAYQAVENLQVTWNGDQEQEAFPALDILKLHGKLQPGETLEAVIRYDVTLSQGPARWAAPVQDFQLQPQVEIESDQALLVDQAAQIAQGKSRQDAYAIYAFTAAYLSWPKGTRLGSSQSALNAYTTRVGGCGEFANLAVALSRAAGIPAQSISGLALPAYPPFWSKTTTWSHPGGAHAWIEMYTGEGWEMADPSWGHSWPGLLKGVWFGRNDGSHLSYGESGQYNQRYAELMSWAEQSGALIGAMSAPLHFVAAADSDAVSVTPSVTLRKGWDGRWAVVVCSYFLLLVMIRVLENKFRGGSGPTPK